MPDTFAPNFTKEEIDSAKKELEGMTPEDLLRLKTEYQIALDAINLNEAPAIAFMELRGPSGAKVNLTVRAITGQQVLDALASAVVYARERYSMNTVGAPINTSPFPITTPEREEPPLPTTDEVPVVYATAQSQPGLYPMQSAPNQSGAPATSDIPVEILTRERKRDGKGDWLRVQGGRLIKFGAACYPEHFPQGLDVTKMQYGIEFRNIPEAMKFAIVTEDKPYRVLGFHN